jgi:hypothetical protein
MAQTLYVKIPGGGQKPVQILRTWLDASGKSVFLHADGRYAYKDGAPLKSPDELDLISDRGQRTLARAWWERFGRKESEEYYRTLEEKQLEAAGDFQESAGDTSDLDAILYVRRPTGKKKGAVTSPHAWMEWFTKRPDWWGQAKKIDFADYTYEMTDIMADAAEIATAAADVKPIPAAPEEF